VNVLCEHRQNGRTEALSVPGTMMRELGLSREDVMQLHEAMMRLIAVTRAVPVP
jgi:hypothetical protein